MEGLYALLPGDSIVTSKSNPPRYKELTTFWAAQINRQPEAVLVPSDGQTLSKVVEYLYHHTELDFGFRGHGYTSLPTQDVLISLESFNEFSYDAEKQTITVGAGQTWMSVYEQIEKYAPSYTGE